jgi:hypothetical protein
MPPWVPLVIIPALWLAGLGGTAQAAGCPVQIMRVGTRYVRESLRVMQRCELEIRQGLIPPQDCRSEPRTLQAMQTMIIAKARAKLRKKCAGATPAQVGFPSAECPAVTTIDELITCLLTYLDARVDALLLPELGCPGRCGDGVADLGCGEACDGADLGGASCTSQGFAGGGTLVCTATCTLYTGFCLP